MTRDARTETANAEFKRRAGDWYWTSLTLAAIVHFVVLAFWPTITTADVGARADEIPLLDMPDPLDIPPPPDELSRPMEPVAGSLDLDDAITIGKTRFEDFPLEYVAPPPVTDQRDLKDFHRPMTLRPRLLNPAEVERALTRTYPPALRNAGTGGRVQLHMLIDEDGTVLRREVGESSGYPALDRAALEVADLMRFAPALNRDMRVAVWINVPVIFMVR